jgi:hypothetical protein
MYGTCLFCNASLGRNDALEAFPVGRRLAFDAAEGRLWVVCRRCERWNLSPFETRWEAIEAAERLYRDTRTRVATDNIGLARVSDGTELVRIGKPLRPEFAAWRYGDQFGRRRWRNVAWTTAAMGLPMAAVAITAGSMWTGVSMMMLANAFNYANFARSMHELLTVRVRLRDARGSVLPLRRSDIAATRFFRDATRDTWRLDVSHRMIAPTGPLLRRIGVHQRRTLQGVESTLEGDDAIAALKRLLPLVNVDGTRERVRSAVTLVSERDEPSRLLDDVDRYRTQRVTSRNAYLGTIVPEYRLALEMALHESDERRALEGELAALEARWREAEEIARIADALTLPDTVETRLASLRGRDAGA